MIEIEEMSKNEVNELLGRMNYGHLATSRNDQPYVVPVHFVYEDPVIYVYTTEGKKSEIIKENPQVCLQTEDVKNNQDWQSVVVTGEAVQIDDADERDKAMRLLSAANPTMTPAVSIRWMDSWVRENIEVILKITPRTITGRATVSKSATDKPFVPGDKRRTIIN